MHFDFSMPEPWLTAGGWPLVPEPWLTTGARYACRRKSQKRMPALTPWVTTSSRRPRSDLRFCLLVPVNVGLVPYEQWATAVERHISETKRHCWVCMIKKNMFGLEHCFCFKRVSQHRRQCVAYNGLLLMSWSILIHNMFDEFAFVCCTMKNTHLQLCPITLFWNQCGL